MKELIIKGYEFKDLEEDAVINVYPKHTYLHATKDNNNNQFQNHAEDWIQQRCSDIQTMNSIESLVVKIILVLQLNFMKH